MNNDPGEAVIIPIDGGTLEGVLRVPDVAEGAILFACANHRRSPQADFLANVLPQNSLATLRVDLLTPAEDALYEERLNLDLLSERLARVAGWMKGQPGLDELPLGLFGVGTSGTSALELAASLGQEVKAVVAWDGRPDLAEKLLRYVTAPTLLIVGGEDQLVRELNEKACSKLAAEKALVVIPGASHRFVEPGTVQAVAERSADWFNIHLVFSGATVAARAT